MEITNSYQLYRKAFPNALFSTVYDESQNKYIDTTRCPWCGEDGLSVYHDLNYLNCTLCHKRETSFSFCINTLSLNGEDLVRFIIGKDGAINDFDMFNFYRCIHKKPWETSEIQIEKPEGWGLAPWEKHESCPSCGCKSYLYKIQRSAYVKCFCCFCGAKIGVLHKTKNKTNNKRANLHNDWVKQVWKRYNGACALCGSRDELEAHHIVPHSVCEEYRYDVNNGILLCHKHHMLAHAQVLTYDLNKKRKQYAD